MPNVTAVSHPPYPTTVPARYPRAGVPTLMPRTET